MRRTAHLSSSRRVPYLRPLVAVARLACLSRNVRISRTLMPYHHKAPQHECARHAGRIVGRRRLRSRDVRHWRLPPLGARFRDGRGGAVRTRAPLHSPRPSCAASLTPISLLGTYLDIINKIIVRHELPIAARSLSIILCIGHLCK